MSCGSVQGNPRGSFKSFTHIFFQFFLKQQHFILLVRLGIMCSHLGFCFVML